ncbi:Eco57I restriction-modification methylase domain-containing protein [Guptibacillus hwajinpoensis]|uniref:Eco57I restriction-modification methylase domain-containing protein n=1 Tax=Guptibacillus hwajinpoensis TaxID=208199 RepID=UPI001CD47F09|nr:N-6 DNA methylase [Pseudalkalibacillus hwajinpoensis]MCA0992968.1 N-6 DNA methylase [Pseudalkalibacillus hwajinpoensis]
MDTTLNDTLRTRKETGSHFTSTGLADVVAKRLINELNKLEIDNQNKLRVLDPACGDGELLLSFKRLAELNSFNNVDLVGVDENQQAVERAVTRLEEVKAENLDLIPNDFLEMINIEENISLFENESKKIDPVDVIIANPPYVRTQVLGSEVAQSLAKKFNLKGKVDLYQAFIIAMTMQLKPGGLLGVITSNRYLTTKGGESLRKFFRENYEIIEVMDLGDTKLFEAAVLPSIFIGRKKSNKVIENNSPANFYKIYEEKKSELIDEAVGFDSVFELLENLESGTFKVEEKFYSTLIGKLIFPESHKEPWVMASDEEYKWIEEVNQASYARFEDIGDIRVGIKTTADNVFISESWDELDTELKPESELLVPLHSADNASRWLPIEKKPKREILYTHTMVDGKKEVIDFTQYERGFNYLSSHREQLEGRKYVTKSRNWYEIWVTQNPGLLKLPKLIFPDISTEPKFFYDDGSCFVDGNCYWISLKDGVDNDLLYLLLGIANTAYLTKYHDIAFQNKLYAGRRRYMTQYVNKYPVPNPDTVYAKDIIKQVKSLVFNELTVEEKSKIEKEIEELTEKAFGVKK